MTCLTGGCRCAAIRYEAEGKPKLQVLCHCRDCQYASGGSPAHAIVMPAAGFRITKGHPRSHTLSSQAGNPVERLFCPDCGTPLFARSPTHPVLISLKVGSLDDPGIFRPHAEIWCASAQPWARLDPTIPLIQGNFQPNAEALAAFGKAVMMKIGGRLGLVRYPPAKSS